MPLLQVGAVVNQRRIGKGLSPASQAQVDQDILMICSSLVYVTFYSAVVILSYI
jgi:hypothetical protein